MTELLTAVSELLTVLRLLLIVKTAPLLGIEVNKEASPANLPKIVPTEIVEKNPKLVDVVIAE